MNLTLNVKKKWFDMILSGEKTEEYREITERRIKQLLYHSVFEEQSKLSALVKITDFRFQYPKTFNQITFLNGMKKLTPKIVIECKGISIGNAKPEWSDNWQGNVFVIKLGNIISTKNLNNGN